MPKYNNGTRDITLVYSDNESGSGIEIYGLDFIETTQLEKYIREKIKMKSDWSLRLESVVSKGLIELNINDTRKIIISDDSHYAVNSGQRSSVAEKQSQINYIRTIFPNVVC